MPPDPPKRRPGTVIGDRNEGNRTPVRGVAIIPSVLPPPPRGEFGFEEKTGVGTDVQVFRAVKALHERLDENEEKAKQAHGELAAKVEALNEKQDRQSAILEKFDEKLDANNAAQAKIVGYLEGQRDEKLARTKSPSSMMRLAQGDASITLLGKVVDDQLKSNEWWRSQTAKIIGAAVSGGGIVAVLHKLGVL